MDTRDKLEALKTSKGRADTGSQHPYEETPTEHLRACLCPGAAQERGRVSLSPFHPRGMFPDSSKLPFPSLSRCSLLGEGFYTLPLPLPEDFFLWLWELFSQHDSSSVEVPALAFLSALHLFSPLPAFPIPPVYPSTTLVRTARLVLILRLLPAACCSILPERAQVVPAGNDCYLQDTLHITSTPFGVFRPSSFCCVSYFAPRARVLKDQGLLFTDEARRVTGLLEVETILLPRASGRHSRPLDVLQLASQYTDQQH